jgi:hypothetical protein
MKSVFKTGRSWIATGWVIVVVVCYCYAYSQYLQKAYPVLQQGRELGLLELMKRFVVP